MSPQQAQSIQARQAASQSMLNVLISQEASEMSFEEWTEGGAGNASFNALLRKSETLNERLRKKEPPPTEENAETEEIPSDIEVISDASKTAEEFEKRNPELKAKNLIVLKDRLTESDTEEDIIAKTMESYPDPMLAEEALDFVIAISNADFAAKLKRARDKLSERYARQIKASRNIFEEARAFSEEGLGSAESLRTLYHHYADNPKDPLETFEEMRSKYSFQQMRKVLAFLLHSLGCDLRSKGPSIDPGQLYRLVTETRNLQAIWGVYRFFIQRDKSFDKNLQRYGMLPKKKITFDQFAILLMQYLKDRYPSPEKVLLFPSQLGLNDELLGQQLLLNYIRESLRHVAPRLFRSPQHRQEVIDSFLEALDNIEDRMEEEEEEEEPK